MKAQENIIESKDTVSQWHALYTVAGATDKEHTLYPWIKDIILSSENFVEAGGKILAYGLADQLLSKDKIMALFHAIHDDALENKIAADLHVFEKHDPATTDSLIPFLFFKGFHALLGYRLAHALWKSGDPLLASHIQARISNIWGVDIHPAAILGTGIMMDHATGIVIGATSVIGNNVLFWHGVTLGGIGYDTGDRHPKIEDNVTLGAQSTLLGNITVRQGAKIGAGSVVLRDVPENTTVVGIPAREV